MNLRILRNFLLMRQVVISKQYSQVWFNLELNIYFLNLLNKENNHLVILLTFIRDISFKKGFISTTTKICLIYRLNQDIILVPCIFIRHFINWQRNTCIYLIFWQLYRSYIRRKLSKFSKKI